jgi:hypothetical protein
LQASAADNRPSWEPDWPADDPAALRWWLEEGGWEKLDRNLNAWLGVIFHAASRIWGSPTGAEREAFRDVALSAIDAGRRIGVLPEAVCAEKEIYARMCYLRNSRAGLTWRRREMARIADVFLGSFAMDIGVARDKVLAWREEPVSVIKSLRETKNLLKLMEPGIGYLDNDKIESCETMARNQFTNALTA